MSGSSMQCYIAGVGTWGPGFNHWQDLQDILNGCQESPPSQTAGPKPECIPANERRRAPLSVRLAVEASAQASAAANIPASDLSCVFACGFGDTDITDHLCRVLLTEEKQISPTKFHNSVHNAAAGYWTISMDCMQSANSIAGFDLSVPLALLEGIALCTSERKPVLVTFYDAPVSDVLESIMHSQSPFSAAIVLTPEKIESSLVSLQASLKAQPCEWQPLRSKSLQSLYQSNPCARSLGLLEALIKPSKDSHSIAMPVSSGSTLELTLN